MCYHSQLHNGKRKPSHNNFQTSPGRANYHRNSKFVFWHPSIKDKHFPKNELRISSLITLHSLDFPIFREGFHLLIFDSCE